jgi:cation diffusion facilitator CzcD-associated flavoprotein CzcO
MRTPDHDVAVIGAGPYGLALATHLRARGVQTQVYGRPMASWLERMPRGMFLKSEGFASSISDPGRRHTLARYCAELDLPYGDCGAPVSLETFSNYGLWFQQTLVPDVIETEVRQARPLGDGFELSLDDGRTTVARNIVIACGFPDFRHTPPELHDLPVGLVSHSSDHVDLDGFRGRSVAVVGAGQSALETAALLYEHGASPTVIARRPVLAWNGLPEPGQRPLRRRVRAPWTGLGVGWRNVVYAGAPFAVHRFPAATRTRLAREVLGPAGAWWLRDRIEGLVPVLSGHELSGAAAEGRGTRLRLDASGSHREIEVDHVIAATGYRVRLGALPFLDAALRERLETVGGAPALSSSFESSVPGLYFVGMAAANSFGPVMRFVCGTGFAARRASGHLAASTRRRERFFARRRVSAPLHAHGD